MGKWVEAWGKVQWVEREILPRAVYNMTVEGMPEYFANGILVHNCDAASGALNKLAQANGAFSAIEAEMPPVMAEVKGATYGNEGEFYETTEGDSMWAM